MKWKSCLPLQLKREVPSGITPRPWVKRIFWHKFVFLLRQNLHSLHCGVYNGMTWSPALKLVTPSPTDSTMPAPSCPRIQGNNPSGSMPESVYASVWHYEETFEVTIMWMLSTITTYNTGRQNLNSNFTSLRSSNWDFLDWQRLLRGPSYSSLASDNFSFRHVNWNSSWNLLIRGTLTQWFSHDTKVNERRLTLAPPSLHNVNHKPSSLWASEKYPKYSFESFQILRG
jgi:hypothetical protein